MNTEKNVEFFISQYEFVYKDLYRFALYTLKNPHDAEDIVSETVTDAYEGFSKLRNLSSFRAWIFRILSNKCKQKLKEYIDKTTELPKTLTDSSKDLTDDLQIRTAFCALLKEERLILSMDIFAGYTSKEIGKILNMNENTVRSKKSRALKKLKEQLNY